MKNLKFIVLSLILMFCFNMNVLAAYGDDLNQDMGSYVRCNYTEPSTKEKIVMDIYKEDLLIKFTYSGSSYFTYPTNNLFIVDNGIAWNTDIEVQVFGGNYEDSMFAGNSSGSYACPAKITNYYNNTMFDSKVNITSDKPLNGENASQTTGRFYYDVPIITFSDEVWIFNVDGEKTSDGRFNGSPDSSTAPNYSNCLTGGNIKNKFKDACPSTTLKSKTYDLNVEEMTEGSKGEDKIYAYVKYLSSNERIEISVLNRADAAGRTFTIKSSGQDITISNIANYENIFVNGDKDKLPKYILKNGNTYEFANSKEGVNAEDTYMYVEYLLQVVIDSKDDVEATCRNLLGDDFLEFLNDNVFKIIYIAVPILLIVLTSFDFAKVVFVDDKEGIQGAFKKFGKRAVAAVLIYFVPTILIFIVNLLGASEVEQCAQAIKNITEQTNSN
ncbi:MAG: hypothetical protein IJ501_06250 [Bacilli bacterium]|nr:hypothetical protein [Bacilli bacterium]